MKTKFTHGPSMTDSDEYEIGPFVLNQSEALEVAYQIIGHYRPHAMLAAQNKLAVDKQNLIEGQP